MKLHACVVVAGLLIASSVRADMLGPGEKGVKLTIQVDATGVPADKVLIIDHTFRGADIVTPGGVSELEWHPLGGEMQIKLIAKSEADKLAPLRAGLEREKIAPITAKAVACGPTFPGVRTIPDSSPADEARIVVRAGVTGDACTAELVRTDYFDKDGKPVAAPGDSAIPPPAPPVRKPAPAPEPAPAKPDPAPATTPAPATSGCNSASTSLPPLGLAALALGLLLRRRRR